MENNRAAQLIIRAAARGVIDYSKFEYNNPKWWQKLVMILREIDAEDHLRYYQLPFMYAVSLLASGNLNEEGVMKCQNIINMSIELIGKLIYYKNKDIDVESKLSGKDKYDYLVKEYKKAMQEFNINKE